MPKDSPTGKARTYRGKPLLRSAARPDHKTNGRGGSRPGTGPPGNTHGFKHGAVLLARLLREGIDQTHPVGRLLLERQALYLADLGGKDMVSTMELGIVERLAKLDLFECLLDARLLDPTTGRARRLSFARLQALGHLRVRLGDSYTRMAAALGLKRRPKEALPTLQEFLTKAATDET